MTEVEMSEFNQALCVSNVYWISSSSGRIHGSRQTLVISLRSACLCWQFTREALFLWRVFFFSYTFRGKIKSFGAGVDQRITF